MSDGLGGQVGAELGADHAAVAVGARHLPPDDACPVGFAPGGHRVAGERRQRTAQQGTHGSAATSSDLSKAQQ